MDDRRLKINEYLTEMLEANKSINLTNIKTLDEAIPLHIDDSLSALDIFRKYCMGNYADLGSGCGFPGIAIAVAANQHVDLIDSSKKKMMKVKEISDRIGISQLVDVIPLRVEEISNERKGFYNIITSRAMTSLSSLIELTSPLLEIGGHLIAYKSQDSKEEYNMATKIEDIVGLQCIEKRDYEIASKHRTLYVYEKTHESRIALPRRNGLAQKRPLH